MENGKRGEVLKVINNSEQYENLTTADTLMLMIINYWPTW